MIKKHLRILQHREKRRPSLKSSTFVLDKTISTFHVSPLITLMSGSDKFPLKAFILLLLWPRMLCDKLTSHRLCIQLQEHTLDLPQEQCSTWVLAESPPPPDPLCFYQLSLFAVSLFSPQFFFFLLCTSASPLPSPLGSLMLGPSLPL